VLQTHVSYVLLVPGLSAVGFAGVLLWAWRDGRAARARAPVATGSEAEAPSEAGRDESANGSAVAGPAPLDTASVWRWIVVAVAAALLCWTPPIAQQLTGNPGNITALIDAARCSLDAGDAAAALIAVEEAKIITTTFALAATTKLFELAGTRFTLEEYGLDRHWRNARTHSLHGGVRWKYHAVGNHLLNGVLPDPWSYGHRYRPAPDRNSSPSLSFHPAPIAPREKPFARPRQRGCGTFEITRRASCASSRGRSQCTFVPMARL
jgi:hypothetical protein